MPVSSDQRAETLAVYLESVQWAVRPCTAHDRLDHIGDDLPVSIAHISKIELCAAIHKLKKNRAAGPDTLPAELWKALLQSPEAVDSLVVFCNRVWEQKEVPEQWRQSVVVASLFKNNSEGVPILNGDYALGPCSNILCKRWPR